MADDSKTPVLEINTLLPKDVIAIDGVTYELIRPDQFLSLFDYSRYERLFNRVVELTTKDDVTDAEEVELNAAVDRMARMVWRAPAEVHDQLTPRQRMQVVTAFLRLPATNRATPAAEPAPTLPLIGAQNSPDSNASTEAIPSAG